MRKAKLRKAKPVRRTFEGWRVRIEEIHAGKPVMVVDQTIPEDQGELKYGLLFDIQNMSFSRSEPAEIEYGPQGHLTLRADFPIDKHKNRG